MLSKYDLLHRSMLHHALAVGYSMSKAITLGCCDGNRLVLLLQSYWQATVTKPQLLQRLYHLQFKRQLL